MCAPVLMTLALAPAAGAATRQTAAAPAAGRVTLGLGIAFGEGGVFTGVNTRVKVSTRGGAQYRRHRLSLAVAGVKAAPSTRRATLRLAGTVQLSFQGRKLRLSGMQLQLGPQGDVTFSIKRPQGGRAGVFTGMTNGSPVKRSGISASSAPMALGDAGDRLIGRLRDLPVEEVQAQTIGVLKIPKLPTG
jgi:hypothetical protein